MALIILGINFHHDWRQFDYRTTSLKPVSTHSLVQFKRLITQVVNRWSDIFSKPRLLMEIALCDLLLQVRFSGPVTFILLLCLFRVFEVNSDGERWSAWFSKSFAVGR